MGLNGHYDLMAVHDDERVCMGPGFLFGICGNVLDGLSMGGWLILNTG
jgi:hypothetical protein